MDYLKSLNTNQYKACTSDSTYLRIIAGAGTGKTQTLSNRIVYFILEKNIIPSQIVAITFTNKAAKAMLERVSSILKKSNSSFSTSPLITTFHGFCLRFLKKEISNLNTGLDNNFTVIDEEDQKKVFKDVFTKYRLDRQKDLCQEIMSLIKGAKSKGMMFNDVDPSYCDTSTVSFNSFIRIYKTYQETLIRQNQVDFDDLIIYTKIILEQNNDVRLHWQKKFKMIFVDEFQDTDAVQYELIKLLLDKLSDNKTMLTVVGDPDQTIYSWRGAENRIIKDLLPRDFPDLESVVLDVNYRSTKEILDASNKLIDNNTDRLKKDLVPFNNKSGEEVKLLNLFSANEEAKYIANNIKTLVENNGYKYSDIAILYRSNYLSNTIEKQLTISSIPYDVYGGVKFYERKEIKDSLAYIKLLLNPNDDLSFIRILQAPSRGVGDVTINNAKEVSEKENISLVEVFNSGKVKLTINAKNGLNNFFEAYNQTIKKDINDFKVIKDYLEMVGLENYIQQLDYNDSKKSDFLAGDTNARRENYYELLNEIKNYLESINVDYEGNETKNSLTDFINNISIQSGQDEIEDSHNKVLLSTCHVAKGLEFNVVFLVGFNDNIFPSSYALVDDAKKGLEEERRLCYVACTRAKEKLIISTYKVGNRPGVNYSPSRFIAELGLKTNFVNSKNIGNINNSGYSSTNNFIGADSFLSKKSNYEIYHIGDRVSHEKYGLGYVVDLDKKTIVINFDALEGLRKFVIDAPQLKKIEGK